MQNNSVGPSSTRRGLSLNRGSECAPYRGKWLQCMFPASFCDKLLRSCAPLTALDWSVIFSQSGILLASRRLVYCGYILGHSYMMGEAHAHGTNQFNIRIQYDTFMQDVNEDKTNLQLLIIHNRPSQHTRIDVYVPQQYLCSFRCGVLWRQREPVPNARNPQGLRWGFLKALNLAIAQPSDSGTIGLKISQNAML